MTNEFISQFLAQFLLYAIGVVVLYLNQRAINKANQDDIKKLTKITEETKKEFTDKTEALKSQLNLLTQHTLSLKNAEMEAIFEYNRIITEYIMSLYNIEISSFNLTNYRTLQTSKEEIQILDKKLTLSYFHLRLFITDELAKQNLTIFDTEIIGYSQGILSSIDELLTRYAKLEDAINSERSANFEEVINNEKKLLEEYKKGVNVILERKLGRLTNQRNLVVSELINRIRTIESVQKT